MEVPVLGDFTLVRDVREDYFEEVIHEQKLNSQEGKHSSSHGDQHIQMFC